MVRLLVDRGADINAENTSGKKPIDIASDASIIDFLKSKGGNTTDLKDVHVKKIIMVDYISLDKFNSKSSDDMASDCSEHNSIFENSGEEIATDYSMPETDSQLLPLKRRADVLEQQPKPEPQPKLSKVEKEEAKEQCIAGKVGESMDLLEVLALLSLIWKIPA
ncbi:hypothetical protein NPIL_297591 [Nephila pilipes]|uniref:Uncharacterized protein n=1 Tax=Nephila pilipes TaxID=299642 RepID=A0A8X6U158_NEPPI|nr:hypothetical protein NPIL_297591 [Nephila pilipes]